MESADFCGLAPTCPPKRSATSASGWPRLFATAGPDDSGVFVDPSAGISLSFRRLSIQDLSPEGHQPMTSASGRYTIVFNGEIYNFEDLRRELEQTGAKFRGHSDTEVMLAAIVAWGVDEALDRFEGMWAFALWDGERSTLTLARDRAGKKPLYFARQDRGFYFASELESLWAHPDFEAEVDRGALSLLVRYGWIPGPSSIHVGVEKLEPGTLVEIDARGECRRHVFWSATETAERCAAAPFAGTVEQAADRLDSLLRDAVRRRMISDVPLGALLSGGIDSSTIVALMQQQSGPPVRTFAIGFREPEYDEAPYAAQVAAHLGTDHEELYVDTRLVQDVIPKLPSMYDEPFADVSQLPTYLVCELARRHVTVALTGDAGDELFLGYRRYARADKRWNKWSRWPAPARAVWSRAVRGTAATLWAARRRALLSRRDSEWPPKSWIARNERKAFRMEARDAVHLSTLMLGSQSGANWVIGGQEPATFFNRPERWPRLPDPLQAMGVVDFATYLRDCILVKVDRASMATSLEARSPLLDRSVVEFAWSLPTPLRYDGTRGKLVLREVLDRYVPRALIDRPKKGFGVPIEVWLRGDLREWAESLLEERRLRQEGFFHAKAVRRAWDQHQAGWSDHSTTLWPILAFQAWNQERP